MTGLMHAILRWRARGLVDRIAPFIEPKARVLDIGCGTGHNAARLQQVRPVEVQGLDVVDMSVVGTKPQLYDGRHIPYPDGTFDVSVLIYMLHYLEAPASFLEEVKRVTKKRIVLVQTTCRGKTGRSMHRANEWMFGKAAFEAARVCGLVGQIPCSMRSRHDLSPEDILEFGKQAGLELETARLERYGGFLPMGRFTCVLGNGPERGKTK